MRITNSYIKVYIPYLLILPNLSFVNSTKQKLILLPISTISDSTKHNLQSFFYQNKFEKNQYLPSYSSNNQFATTIKSSNKGNNIVTTIEELFLNIRDKSSYKKLTEKAIHKICEFLYIL